MLEQLKKNVKNKAWWVSVVSLLILLAQRFGLNLTDYIGSNWQDTLNTIFSILVLLGISVDTTAATISSGSAGTTGKPETIQETVNSNTDNNSTIVSPITTQTATSDSSNSIDISASGTDGSVSSSTDAKNATVVNSTIKPKEPTV